MIELGSLPLRGEEKSGANIKHSSFSLSTIDFLHLQTHPYSEPAFLKLTLIMFLPCLEISFIFMLPKIKHAFLNVASKVCSVHLAKFPVSLLSIAATLCSKESSSLFAISAWVFKNDFLVHILKKFASCLLYLEEAANLLSSDIPFSLNLSQVASISH